MSANETAGGDPEVEALVLMPPERLVDPDQPWGDDLLDRAKYGGALTDAVHGLRERGGAVLLDGGYGTGKTYVLERWAQDLRKAGFPVREYNAWEHDGADDPLSSLVECLADGDAEHPLQWTDAVDVVGSVALIMGTGYNWSGPLKKAVRKLALPAAAWMAKQCSDEGRDCIVKRVFKQLTERILASDRVRRTTEARDALRGGLSRWAQNVGPHHAAVVIIDELDRCMPSFALRVLERVKHVLQTPGVVFVFGTNYEALSNSFPSECGSAADADGYFLRMFDFLLTLPPSAFVPDQAACTAYVEALADRHRLAPLVKSMPRRAPHATDDYWTGELAPMLISLAGGGRMTPRELQALMRGLAASVLMSVHADGAKAPLGSFIMLPMLAAKMKAPEAYARMVAASNGAAGVIDCMAELMDEQRSTPSTPVDPGVVDECLDLIETTLYRACRDPYAQSEDPAKILEMVAEGKSSEVAEADWMRLASRSRWLGAVRAEHLLQRIEKSDGEGLPLVSFQSIRTWDERINMIRVTR